MRENQIESSEFWLICIMGEFGKVLLLNLFSPQKEYDYFIKNLRICYILSFPKTINHFTLHYPSPHKNYGCQTRY